MQAPDFVSQRLQFSLVNAAKPILLILLFLSSSNSFAQDGDKEAVAVIELGAAAERSLTEAQSSFGPTVAVEFTPIENWLELEAGVTPLFRRHSTEWTTDLLFRSRGRCPTRMSSCWGSARSGFIRTHLVSKGTQKVLKSPWTSCSGHPRSTELAGTLNRATTTSSGRRIRPGSICCAVSFIGTRLAAMGV